LPPHGSQRDGVPPPPPTFLPFHDDSEEQPSTATTATTRKGSDNSSGERGSWSWPETTDLSAPEDYAPHQLRVDADVLARAQKLPVGHPDSPWGWPENSNSPPSAAESAERQRAMREQQ
jgi:hypothetical protein